MANFLLVYTGGVAPASEEEGKQVMEAWTKWFTGLGAAVVDGGNPIKAEAKSIASNGRVSNTPVGTPAMGYSIIKAESLDTAVELAKSCPHLKYEGAVSVYETFPVM